MERDGPGQLWKKPEDSGIGLLMAEMQREADLRDQGWLPFYPHIWGTPYPNGLIDIMQRDGSIWTTEYASIPPQWNIAGKFWRQARFTEGLTIEGLPSSPEYPMGNARKLQSSPAYQAQQKRP